MEYIFSKKRTEGDGTTEEANISIVCNSHKIDDLVSCFQGFLTACGYEDVKIDYSIKKK